MPSFIAGLTRGFDRIGEWRERRRQRLALAALDDHLLKDVGLSRADIAAEIDRPFWR